MEKLKVDYSRVSKKVEKSFFYIKKKPYYSQTPAKQDDSLCLFVD
jgi:hypothetical protein